MFASCIVAGSNLFFYCFFGQLAHESYMNLSDCFYNSKWPHLAPDLQKIFVVLIAIAQRPLFYHGFGIIHLNLNSFNRVSEEILGNNGENEIN